MQPDDSIPASALNSESSIALDASLATPSEEATQVATASGIMAANPQGGSQSYIALSLRRLLRKRIAVFFMVVILIMYGSAIIAPLISLATGYGYNDQDLSVAKEGPGWTHPLGTDRLGRDMLVRVIFGLRTTVLITVIALLGGSLFIGISLGLLGGYFGGKIDAIINRVGEVTSAFPEVFLLLIIVATIRPRIIETVRNFEDATGIDWIIEVGVVDYATITFALTIFAWFGMSRLVRGQVLQVRENQYVEAARAIGNTTPRILRLHVLPNLMSPVIVSVSASLASFAGAELFLSFLGIGVQPPVPSLGRMIFENGNISVMRSDPHLILAPVLTVAVLLFSFNMLGDAVNDAFNPRLR